MKVVSGFMMALLLGTGTTQTLTNSQAQAQTLALESVRVPKMTPTLNLGRMNFEAYCAACHGKKAQGTEAGPTFLSRIYHPGHHNDAAFYNAPKKGMQAHHWQFGDMPPVDGITVGRLKPIIAYIRALQKENGVF